jgi:transposase InsO family protein
VLRLAPAPALPRALGSWVAVHQDNAVVESFFGTLKRELVHRRTWPTRREAAEAIHEYIEVFYNRRRRHTT